MVAADDWLKQRKSHRGYSGQMDAALGKYYFLDMLLFYAQIRKTDFKNRAFWARKRLNRSFNTFYP